MIFRREASTEEPEEAEADAPSAAGNRGGSRRGNAPARGGRRGGRGGRGRGAFTDRRSRGTVVVEHPGVALAEPALLERTPTRLESECNPEDLKLIRELF